MNFWSVIQNAHDQFINSFKWELVSREKFNTYKIKYKNNDYNNNVERAKIFYYLVRAGFAADMKNPVFGTSKRDGSILRIEQIEESISRAHERLLRVTIENKSFEDIFRIYDGEKTFFYLDPPYRKAKQYATGKFTDEQYKLLSECCKNAKGKWMLTINDDEYIRKLFKEFNIMNHEIYYGVCKTYNGRAKFKELIITNYDI